MVLFFLFHYNRKVVQNQLLKQKIISRTRNRGAVESVGISCKYHSEKETDYRKTIRNSNYILDDFTE